LPGDPIILTTTKSDSICEKISGSNYEYFYQMHLRPRKMANDPHKRCVPRLKLLL